MFNGKCAFCCLLLYSDDIISYHDNCRAVGRKTALLLTGKTQPGACTCVCARAASRHEKKITASSCCHVLLMHNCARAGAMWRILVHGCYAMHAAQATCHTRCAPPPPTKCATMATGLNSVTRTPPSHVPYRQWHTDLVATRPTSLSHSHSPHAQPRHTVKAHRPTSLSHSHSPPTQPRHTVKAHRPTHRSRRYAWCASRIVEGVVGPRILGSRLLAERQTHGGVQTSLLSHALSVSVSRLFLLSLSLSLSLSRARALSLSLSLPVVRSRKCQLTTPNPWLCSARALISQERNRTGTGVSTRGNRATVYKQRSSPGQAAALEHAQPQPEANDSAGPSVYVYGCVSVLVSVSVPA